jgi:hypothetical protein
MVRTTGGEVVDLPAHPVRWSGAPSMESPADQVEPTPSVPVIGAHTERIRVEFGADAAPDSIR